MKLCNYDCECWEEEDGSNRLCDNCKFFQSITRDEAGQLSLHNPFFEEIYDDMFDRGLDIMYLCSKRHYIRHRYSGFCKDWEAKL